MKENKTSNTFLNAQKQIKNACELYWECKNGTSRYELISHPKRILEVNIPVRMDDWNIKTFIWYRSQHNDSRGPFKWGIRFHPEVDISEVKALSMWMTFKTAVTDIPLWGWKWWIVVNPKKLSVGELERLSRWYVRALYKYIWPEVDIPAPDINTNSQIMAWMMDEYSKLVWKYSPGSFTWKPLSSGWSKWRLSSTAQWWVYVLKKILELRNEKLKWKKIIIQWAWNAWLIAAELLVDLWTKIIWISDSRWWIYNENWLNIWEIIRLKLNKKSVTLYKDWEILKNWEILEQECDILIPAALENQITDKNVKNIKAHCILELANWPITPEADQILFEKNITVIPDILANSWWVIVSYFEQVQNNINFYWEEEEIDQKLYNKITKASIEVYEKATELNTYLRNWAYIIALERVLTAMKDRGEL